MKPNTAPAFLSLACWILVMTIGSGCSRWIEIAPVSAGPEPTAQQIARGEQVPLIMDHIRTTRNGSPQNTSAETEQRILGSFAELGLFSQLSSRTNALSPSSEKIIRARLIVDEAVDPHAGSAAWKSIVLGASMYMLTPLIPLEYDYAARIALELERWDGQIKRYEGQSSGTVHYQLFGATPIMIDELKGHVTETCLNELARQIVRDTAFYTASSAPLSESGIRTVSVKRRSPRIPEASSTAIPVSAAAPSEP